VLVGIVEELAGGNDLLKSDVGKNEALERTDLGFLLVAHCFRSHCAFRTA
jgi:hypothetical protein